MQSVSGTPNPGDWQQAAREVAQGAVQRMDSFHLIGAHEKRMSDGQAALEQMDSMQAGSDHPLHATVEMVRAMSAAATSSPRDQEIALRTALESVAANGAASVAGGSTPLATLAIRILSEVTREAAAKDRSAPTAGMADAAFSSMSTQASNDWIVFVRGLSGCDGQGRLELAARPLENCSMVEAADRVVSGAALDMDSASRLDLLRHGLDQLVARSAAEGHARAPHLELLKRFAGTPPTEVAAFSDALVAGIRAAVQEKASPATVCRAVLQRLQHDGDAAAVGRIAVDSMPASGWGAWGRMAMGGVTGAPAQALVARHAVDGELRESECTAERVAISTQKILGSLEHAEALAVARPLVDALQAVVAGGQQAASLVEVRAVAGRMGLDNLEMAQAAAALCRPQEGEAPPAGAPGALPLGLADLGRMGGALELDRMDAARAHVVTAGLLREAASVVAKAGDVEAGRGVRMLQAALEASNSASRSSSVFPHLVEALDRLPHDAKAAASLTCDLLDMMPRPAQGLDMLGAVLPEVQAFSSDPSDVEMVGVLRSAVSIEPYEAETLLRGVRAGLETLAAPSEVLGSLLAFFVERVAGNMNYWVDEAAVMQAGRDALAREATRLGDPALGDCVRFMQRVDDEVDVSDEKERVAVQRRALDWLAEKPTSGRDSAACLREMAADMRHATERHMRDIRAGQVAAKVMGDVAKREMRQDLRHEARFLEFLADRHAENVDQRLTALYGAMEAQGTSTSTGGQRLAEMARAAMDAYEPYQDQVLVARSALRTIEKEAAESGHEGTARMAACMHDLSEVRLVGEKPRVEVAAALIEALARTPEAAPGILASVGRTMLDALDSENARVFSGPLLDAIGSLATSLGEKVYVPDILDVLRRDLGAAVGDEAWAERLQAGLQELERFQGEGLAHAISVGRTQGRRPGDAPQIQASEDTVDIGGIKVPVRGRE